MRYSSASPKKPKRLKRIRAEDLADALLKFIHAVERERGFDLGIRRVARKRQVLSAQQTARLMHLSPKTLANWRNLGKGPAFYKIGSRCFYRRADVVRFCRDRKARSTSQYFPSDIEGGRSNG